MRLPRIAIPVPTSLDPEYNLRCWPQYAAAVERSGGNAVQVPLGRAPALTAKLVAECAGVVLPGSGADVNPQKYGHEAVAACAPADAARENVDELLLQDAHNMGKPILAICFGTQMLNVWRGGTLVQDLLCIPVNHSAGSAVGEGHSAALAPQSLLWQLAANDEAPEREGYRILRVNSSHHQAIGVTGDGLHVVARSTEDGVIEAVEAGPQGWSGGFMIGVQWHPERSFEESATSRALFGQLVAEAKAWIPRRAIASTV